MNRDIETIIENVKRLVPTVQVWQHHVNNPGVDDDGVWFFTTADAPKGKYGLKSIQLESSTGVCPFVVEHDGKDSESIPGTVDSVPQAVDAVCLYLTSLFEERAQELKRAGDYAGALRLRLEMERLQSSVGAKVREQTKNLNHIAHVGVHAGALSEAERAARKCLALYRPIATEQDERFATYLMMLSSVLAESGKFDEAAAYGEQAVVIFALIHGEKHRFVGYCRDDIERMRRKDTQPYLDKA